MGSLVRLLRFEGGNAHLVEVTLADDSPAGERRSPISGSPATQPSSPSSAATGSSSLAATPDWRSATKCWPWSPPTPRTRCSACWSGPDRDAGRLLRPGQDGHRQGVDRGVRTALLPGRADQPQAGRPLRGVPDHLPPPRARASRSWPGCASRCSTLTKGWDRDADQGDRAGGARGDGRADHLRGGPRPHRGAPGGRAPRLPGVGGTRGDRGTTRRAPRGRRMRSPRGRWSTRRVATRARWTSTPTGPSRPRPCGELGRRREDLDLAESSAYSDSYTDLPMLEAVGHPVAVNPDRVLAKVARERDWEVMHFTKPVRLRDRVSVPACRSQPRRPGSPRRHRRRRWRRGASPAASGSSGSAGASSTGAATGRCRVVAETRDRRRCRGHRLVDSGRTEPLRGHRTENDDDSENQELLHERQRTRSAWGRSTEAARWARCRGLRR